MALLIAGVSFTDVQYNTATGLQLYIDPRPLQFLGKITV